MNERILMNVIWYCMFLLLFMDNYNFGPLHATWITALHEGLNMKYISVITVKPLIDIDASHSSSLIDIDASHSSS